MIEFEIFGEPVAQGRPRATTINGHTRVYDPVKSRDYKHYIKLSATQHRPKELLNGPLAVEIDIYRPIPKSMPKYKRAWIQNGDLRPVTKPDVDNYVKGIKDGLSNVIWEDDRQIVDLQVRKWYSDIPRVKVKVESLELNEQQQLLKN
ncbi:RusA family crossover junction endodeoxyribonuclease [Halalkalibacillus sediminis]|uniref:RusA family crossover junction endodeoxyribonuclease n=1 Tax=Halalkalibacillus sediminis TaxID=2018042 RepID=A0A2I0QYJ9_9BACI|nr:RusA family crossover junction endodeoxyribonuclease [Halalkalibacillus sediminis]PKR79411.1 RusA family crossover junction endodeoxyribonuclease [Halalkalibacillus sediminis]